MVFVEDTSPARSPHLKRIDRRIVEYERNGIIRMYFAPSPQEVLCDSYLIYIMLNQPKHPLQVINWLLGIYMNMPRKFAVSSELRRGWWRLSTDEYVSTYCALRGRLFLRYRSSWSLGVVDDSAVWYGWLRTRLRTVIGFKKKNQNSDNLDVRLCIVRTGFVR